MRAKRLVLAIALVCATFAVGYVGLDAHRGTRLVRELCAKDGGIRIFQRVEAKGFLDESAADAMYCSGCFERLIKRQFEYIDVHVPGNPDMTNTGAIRPGFYRLSIAERGDLRCELWKKNVNLETWTQQQRRLGLRDSQCVAVDSLPTMPTEPVYRQTYYVFPNGGDPDVKVSDWTLSNSVNGELIARRREYYFHLKISRLSWDPYSAAYASCGVSQAAAVAFGELGPITPRSSLKASANDVDERP